MSKKLFVGGLSWGTNEASLREAFSAYGEVTDAAVIVDRDTGRSKGYGFVTFADDGAGSEAISQLDGAELDSRQIRVSEARPREPRAGGDFGGRGPRQRRF